jgi:hypothetical protein
LKVQLWATNHLSEGKLLILMGEEKKGHDSYNLIGVDNILILFLFIVFLITIILNQEEVILAGCCSFIMALYFPIVIDFRGGLDGYQKTIS